ncbi:MAG: 50S ribosomal protein L30 [Bacillota bacterium]|jgi:large subunit ribosomal protein L30
MTKIKITLTKSPIGYNKNQKAILASLGLRKLNSSVVQEDTKDILGKTQKVAHLVKVETFDEQEAK